MEKHGGTVTVNYVDFHDSVDSEYSAFLSSLFMKIRFALSSEELFIQCICMHIRIMPKTVA